jgi:hypothetical protein
MKRFLLIALLLCVLAAPVFGAVSPIKTTFQDYSVISSWPTVQGDWLFYSTGSPQTPDTYGHVVTTFTPNGITNNVATPFTYAAFTDTSPPTWNIGIQLQNSARGVIYTYDSGGAASSGRYEVKMIGGQAQISRDGAVLATSGVLATNPSYIRIYNIGSRTADDFVIGDSSDSTIVSAPPSSWFVLYDSLSPASTGLYATNATFGGNPILKNSNYFGASYGRGTSTATTLNLINPIGTVVHSYPVSNYSCECVLSIADLYQDGLIMPGYWTVQLADSPLSPDHFWVLSGSASVSMDKTSYNVGDSGIATYYIPSSYWDATTYNYKLRVVDVYGTTLEQYNIAGPSSSQTVSFATADGSGVRFIEVVRIKNSDSTESIIGYTSTTVYEYLGFSGKVYDGNTSTVLSGAAYNFMQGSTILTGTSGFDGNFSVTGFSTGTLTQYNFTKSGYVAWNYSFTPLATGTKTLTVTLYPITAFGSGTRQQGRITDNVYGSAISTVTSVTLINASSSFPGTANAYGYYNIGGLTSGTCYFVNAVATGFLFVGPAGCRVVI